MAKGSLRVNGIIVDTDGEIKASTGDNIVIREDDGSAVITVDTNGKTSIGGPMDVGVDDTGHDVKFFGATSGKSWLWDESADKMIITGDTQLTGAVTVGVDDTGHDVKFFGATSGKYMLWDESADSLISNGTLDISSGTLTTSTAQKTAIVDGGKGNLTKSDVGLANADNTADSAKPVSTAQQTEIDKLAYQGEPHIIPGVLYPAVAGKLLDGTTSHSGNYGTTQSDSREYYYTDIKGSKPIKDPRIGGHFGSQRHKFKSLQLLEQETATHSKNVYSVDGREWLRFCGTPTEQNGDNGYAIRVDAAGDFLEITGYFNQFNFLEPLYQSGTARNRWIMSVDGTATVTESSNPAGVDNPLGGRNVDNASLRTFATGITQPRIVTIKMTENSNDGNNWMSGCELIAQDTTSTANRSKIQIPSQDVVSYGKKFSVSGTPHYNPFAYAEDGTTTVDIGNTSSHGKLTGGWASGGTTAQHYDSTLDTATSLGLSAWVDSGNYYRPVNGGRIVKWVDENGNIKTSVNLMPPAARHIAGGGNNGLPTGTSWLTSYQPSFMAGDPDHTQAEVTKSFLPFEFGNGGANYNNSYRDASSIGDSSQTSFQNIAFVMDDGLTSLAGENVAHGTGATGTSIYAQAEKHIFYTFIGTGVSLESYHSGTSRHIAQNLPYGTHVLEINTDSGHNTTILKLDGVQLDSSTNYFTYGSHNEMTFFQPKRPPIPEDAVILADYMLYADWVPIGDAETGYISKGARRIHGSRDVFVNRDSGTNDPTLTLYPQELSNAGSANFGFRLTPGSGSPCSIDLPVFSNKFAVYAENPSAAGHAMSFGGTSSTITKLDNSVNDDLDAFVGPSTSTDLGVNKLEYTALGGYHFAGFDSAGIIHTSHHYQSFETPFLHELVGGDRNMEQHNLVCSPDGKTWDEVTRDTSYLGKVSISASRDGGDVTSSGAYIWDYVRGASGVKNYFNKHFAIAYDRFICLEQGFYEINVQIRGATDNQHLTAKIRVNGTDENFMDETSQSAEKGLLHGSLTAFLKRGDWFYINRTAGDLEGGTLAESHLIVKRI